MIVHQFEIPVGWGQISGQIYGDPSLPNCKPLLALHGFLDNSNSFKPLAPYLIKNGEYYIIAVDLPGMGFSSKIPDGIPYSTKFYVMSIRRVVNHFKLDKFIFITHSFGCSLGLAYSACYQDEVLGLALLDFAMKECNIEVKDNIAECWKEGIETYLRSERLLEEKAKKPSKTELTYDHALSRLLESNKHIDEMAAIILLERGLNVIDGKYEYCRDIKLVTGISMRDYHAEYAGIYDSLFKRLSSPVMLIYADPPSFGQTLFDQILFIMSEINKNPNSPVELVPFQGTHHFHMLKPAETSEFVLKFLKDKYKPKDSDSNNNLNIVQSVKETKENQKIEISN